MKKITHARLDGHEEAGEILIKNDKFKSNVNKLNSLKGFTEWNRISSEAD